MLCFFVTDLHGKIERYKKLFDKISSQKPDAVFLGGDLLPSGLQAMASYDDLSDNFIENIIKKGFLNLKNKLKNNYPDIFLILGNDDGKIDENKFIELANKGLWKYCHNKKIKFKDFNVYGYSYVPPTPFLLKDWEKYDVSRYVDPGCVPPTQGYHSFDFKKDEIEFSTIKKDLENLTKNDNLSKAIFLFHSPPYNTFLDRAALDGQKIDHVPLDVHVGSIAIERFLKTKQPLLSLHGHVHESSQITGKWLQKIGKTIAINGAHKGTELSLIKFDPNNLENAKKELI